MSLLVGKLEAVAGAVQVAFTQCDVSRLLSTHCPIKKRTMTTTKIIQKNSSNVSSSPTAPSHGERSHISTATALISSEIDEEGMEAVQPINAPDVTLLVPTLASTTDPSLPGHQIPVSSNNNNDHMNDHNNNNNNSNNDSNTTNNSSNNNNNNNNDNNKNKKKKTKRGCRAGKLVKSRQTSSINGRQNKSKGPMEPIINVRPAMYTLPPPTSMAYAQHPQHPQTSSSSSTYTATATVAVTTARAPIYPPVVYPYHIPPLPSATSYPPAASSNSSSSSSSNIHNHNHAYHNRNSSTLYPPITTAQTPGLGGLGFPIPNLPPQGPSTNTTTNLNAMKRKRPSHPVSVSVGDRLVARIKANAALDSTIVWDKPRGKSSSSSQHQRKNDKLLDDEKQVVVQPQQQRSHQDVLQEGNRLLDQSNVPSSGQGSNRLTHNDEAEGRAFSGGMVRDTVTSLAGIAEAAQQAAEYSSSEDDDDQGQDENEQGENTRCYYSQEDWMYKRKKRQKTKASVPRLAVREGSSQDQRQNGQGKGQSQGESQDQAQSDSQGHSQNQEVDQGQGQGQGEGQEMDQELGERQGRGNDHANSHDILGEPVEDDVIRHTDDDDVMTIEDPCPIITSQAATINTTLSSSSSSTSSRVTFVALDTRLIGSDTSSSSTGNTTAAPPVPFDAPPAPPVLLTDSSTVSTTGHGSSQSVYPPSETSSQWHRNVLEGDAVHDIYPINTPSQYPINPPFHLSLDTITTHHLNTLYPPTTTHITPSLGPAVTGGRALHVNARCHTLQTDLSGATQLSSHDITSPASSAVASVPMLGGVGSVRAGITPLGEGIAPLREGIAPGSTNTMNVLHSRSPKVSMGMSGVAGGTAGGVTVRKGSKRRYVAGRHTHTHSSILRSIYFLEVEYNIYNTPSICSIHIHTSSLLAHPCISSIFILSHPCILSTLILMKQF